MTASAERAARDPAAADGRGASARHAAIPAAMLAALTVASLWPLWSEPGWPQNHEGGSFGPRTYIYARHLERLDLLPLWSSSDAEGFGSPLPLMYHKLYYLLAGSLALVTDTIKTADIVALALLLCAGAAGMYLTVRELGGGRVAAVVAGGSLIVANYTVTNWLVRGAVAESSAAMVVPWVLRYFVRTLQTGRVAPGLGITMGLLWLGHSVLMFFTGIILIATYLVLAFLGMAPWSVLRPSTAWRAAALFLVIVAPYLAAMPVVAGAYDFERILTRPYRPMYQFKPLEAYIDDDEWEWGRIFAAYTTELDRAMLIALGLGAAALVWRYRRTPRAGWAASTPAAAPALLLSFALVLQLRSSAPFYALVPGAEFIQFPWRLLALMTPALIIVAVVLVERSLPRRASHAVLAGALGWMVVSCGAFAPIHYERIQIESFNAAGTFSLFREYEPKTAPPLAELRERIAARWKAAGCSYEARDMASAEVGVISYDTSCERPAVLPLPLYASPLHVVTTSEAEPDGACQTLPDLTMLCAATVPAGRGHVSVDLPDLRTFATWLLRQAPW